jgi:acyl-CoA thioesterase I
MMRRLLRALAILGLGVCGGSGLLSAPLAFAQEPADRPADTPALQQLAMAPMAKFDYPAAPPILSTDCRSRKVAGEDYRRPLRTMRRAVRANNSVKVLAIGSSSTVGVGATRPAATYVARLENDLEGVFKGLDFDVVGKGMSGEDAEGQSARMRQTVEEVKPDLVVWQVGTNDAIRHVDMDAFKNCLRRTLTWLRDNRFDVVLVDPQYSEELTKDAYYEEVVNSIAEVAKEMRVLLVDRFSAMKELSREHGDRFYLAADNLHLNDTGHRCMAEQIARAIVGGLLLADAEPLALSPSIP